MFEAICNAFGALPILHEPLRNWFASIVTDEDIDKYAQYHLNARNYKEFVKYGKGGDLELIIISKWAKCKVIVLVEQQEHTLKEIYEAKTGSEFTIFFKRTGEGEMQGDE
jgi:hypothetical protein